jgi:ubiquinone/menaquinone biosynthesis C-methylase UbiE
MHEPPKVDRPYQGAATYYARYRPPYPAALAPMLRDAFHLDGSGRLLDLGCGPGPVAIRLAPLFERVVGMDPEPDMLAEGAVQAALAGVTNIEWVRGRSEELSPDLGTFRLATMGESFHWMDQAATLEALYELVEEGGGVAILSRGTPLPLLPMTPWRTAVARILRQYLGDIRLPWDGQPPEPGTLHQDHIRRSRFELLSQHTELFEVPWTFETMLGNLYSMSFCNRDRLGDRAEAFERDLRAAVLAVEPSGELRGEQREFFALLAVKRAPIAG